jgi:hypothetical protein
MSHQATRMEIESWKEGPSFVPTLNVRRQESRIHPALAMDLADEAILTHTLKPIGFHVAYSYTLFRRGTDPRDPLYAFF